jgi:hypothetical protein
MRCLLPCRIVIIMDMIADIRPHRIDDIPLLMELLQQMKLAFVIDNVVPTHAIPWIIINWPMEKRWRFGSYISWVNRVFADSIWLSFARISWQQAWFSSWYVKLPRRKDTECQQQADRYRSSDINRIIERWPLITNHSRIKARIARTIWFNRYC